MYFEIEYYGLTKESFKSKEELEELLHGESWGVAEYMCRLIWSTLDDDEKKLWSSGKLDDEAISSEARYILENTIERLQILIQTNSKKDTPTP